MEVKQGYKLTEIGVIPEDWKLMPIAELCWFQEGPGVRKAQFRQRGVKLLNGTNIARGVLDLESTVRYITKEEAFGPYSHFMVDAGDIVIASSGITIDRLHEKVAVVTKKDLPLCMNTSTIRFKVKDGYLLPGFLFQFLSSSQFKESIGGQATGSAQLNFGPSHIQRLVVATPKLGEQHAIAKALSDIDALLSSLDRLIAKKRDLKQAAMQQLLTGITRLPAFHQKWKQQRLSDIGAFIKGAGIRRDEVLDDGLPCVRYGEIYTFHDEHLRTFRSYISKESASMSRQINTGDILFAGSGETAREIGKCVAYLDQEVAFAGGDIIILRPVGQCSRFLGHLLNYGYIVDQKTRMAQGDAVVHISAASLSNIEVLLPPVEEQEAISESLFLMNNEIIALESQRQKSHHLKQGMMQELLTGKTRLVEPKPRNA